MDHEDIIRCSGIQDGVEEFALLSCALNDMALSVLQGTLDKRTGRALGLLVKFYAHAASAFHLARGAAIPTGPELKLDMPSVFIISRAAYETLFRFHHIFAEPQTQEARDCMYRGWELASYRRRQSYPATLQSSKETLAEERDPIAHIEDELSRNPYFQSLSKGERRSLKKDGKTAGWGQIALSAGLQGIHADHWYGYLCGHAHSGWVDVGMFALLRPEDIARQIQLALETIMIALAFILQSFAEVFPSAAQSLTGDQMSLISAWKQFGMTEAP